MVKPDYAEMRNMVSFREAENMTYKDMQEILLFGTKPYMDMSNDKIMDMFIDTFGSSYIPKKEVRW